MTHIFLDASKLFGAGFTCGIVFVIFLAAFLFKMGERK